MPFLVAVVKVISPAPAVEHDWAYEGGQLPLIQRLPRKRGFTNIFKTDYCIVNLSDLNMFEANSEVSPQKLYEVGLIKSGQLAS